MRQLSLGGTQRATRKDADDLAEAEPTIERNGVIQVGVRDHYLIEVTLEEDRRVSQLAVSTICQRV